MVQSPRDSAALPPPPRDRPGVPWMKIGAFVLFVLVLGGLANVLLDEGLGQPDEARRARQPAGGFSIGVPIGWAATNYGASARVLGGMRVTAERSAGRQTSIVVDRLRLPPSLDALTPTTFQDQPARLATTRGKYDWTWRLRFARGDAWYELLVTSPIELDMKRDPLLAYVNSFRVEQTTAPAASLAVPPTSEPAAAGDSPTASESPTTGGPLAASEPAAAGDR